MKKRIQTLERTLHEEVPLTRQMGIRVEDHDGRELLVKADFEPNINIHGTAFGGSLFRKPRIMVASPRRVFA